jgi:hypothetical protein
MRELFERGVYRWMDGWFHVYTFDVFLASFYDVSEWLLGQLGALELGMAFLGVL